MRDEVTVHMAATPEQVWDLVSDVTRIGSYSPETFEAEWLDDASGPAEGVRFRGHVRRNGRGPVYWTSCTIVRCDPEAEFAFVVGKPDKHMMTWGYRLAPAEVDEGESPATDVTEFYESADDFAMRLYWKLFKGRRRTNAEGMRTTLERLKVAAET